MIFVITIELLHCLKIRAIFNSRLYIQLSNKNIHISLMLDMEFIKLIAMKDSNSANIAIYY